MNLIKNELPSGCVMTLKDVVDIINNARGVKSKGDEGFLQHGRSKTTIEKMAETTEFGTVTQFVTVNYDKNGKIQGNLETLALTKKQAIAAGARLDNTMLMQVINRVEELENERKQNLPTLPQTFAEALHLAAKLEEEKQLALAKIERDKPRVEFSERIETAVNSINIGSYAKVISKEQGINVGQNKLFAFLRDNGILIKSGRRRNFPTSRYMNNDYFEIKTSSVATSHGVRGTNTTLITGKGQVGLVNKIVDHFTKEKSEKISN